MSLPCSLWRTSQFCLAVVVLFTHWNHLDEFHEKPRWCGLDTASRQGLLCGSGEDMLLPLKSFYSANGRKLIGIWSTSGVGRGCYFYVRRSVKALLEGDV